ncbi:MAG: oxidoreductase [Burkholderiales bacterium]|nr:oxidoreductase [Flavobacterium sp.]
MARSLIFLSFAAAFVSCTSKKNTLSHAYQSVMVDTLLNSKRTIRAMVIEKETIWYAADNGCFGYYNISNNEKFENKIDAGNNAEFRSIAKTSKDIFLLNVGNPAKLYQISKSSKQPELVYQEDHEKVFYDSMQFWNELEGIAVGDPLEDCLSIITTRDGGDSWQKTSCPLLPKVVSGEAAFAASNTNIVIKKNKTWIVSGGKKARIFYSPDKGRSWSVFETPITQGLEMTGIFTADFYNTKMGFIAGGNYEIPNQNFNNKAITADGGRTWRLTAQHQGFGYASCVQYVPESSGRQLVCVGATGLQYSSDSGENWIQLLDNKDLYTIRFLKPDTAVAAGRNIMLLLHFK